MDNQDQLYKLFKGAADQVEKEPDFPSMEKIWIQVEERLDHGEEKRILFSLGKTSIAAAVLLLLSIGGYFAFKGSDQLGPHIADKHNIEGKQIPSKYDDKNNDTKQNNVIAQVRNEKESNKVSGIYSKAHRVTKSKRVMNGAEIRDDFFRGDTIANIEIITNRPERKVTYTGSSTVIGSDAIVARSMEKEIDQSIARLNGVRKNTSANRQKANANPNSFAQDEVIYGKRINKSTTVGSAGLIAAEQIPQHPIISVSKAIEGQVAGIQTTSGGGQPGANPKLNIRGPGSVGASAPPLIVIDGLVYNAGLETINPNNVASISILKDASSSALYGCRSVNGVILITTKNSKKQSGISKAWYKFRNLFRRKQAITNYGQVIIPQSEISIDGESYASFEENSFESPFRLSLSTFSIDVDNASYTRIRRFINNGQTVPKDAVRIEEMINFFTYNYSQPTDDHPFAIHTEYSNAPWNKQHKLLKIGLQGKNIPLADLPASNLVFLIDVSGSMAEESKLPLLKSSLKMLTEQLRSKDKVAIVVYAGAAGIVLPPTNGDQKGMIIAALDRLSAGGSTAGGAGIELAYKLAQENFVKGGNNRVILATDGDFNVGPSSDADIQKLIEEKRKRNIFLTCLGYGMGNYKDSKMETLADKGNGNYAYIDDIKEADRFLVREFSGMLFSIAKDVKIQVEFNPQHVQAYRLIGYENRKLRDEDFTNDAVDAGELGSGHSVTALYEIIPAGVQSEYYHNQPGSKYTQTTNRANLKDELATIKFRYKNPDSDRSIEIVKAIPDKSIDIEATSPDFKLATAVAWFGLKLRDSELVPDKKKQSILDWISGPAAAKDNDVQELIRLIQSVR